MKDSEAERIVQVFRDAGMRIESGANYSVVGQIAQLLNGVEALMGEAGIEIGRLQTHIDSIIGDMAGDTCIQCNWMERADCHAEKERLRKIAGEKSKVPEKIHISGAGIHLYDHEAVIKMIKKTAGKWQETTPGNSTDGEATFHHFRPVSDEKEG